MDKKEQIRRAAVEVFSKMGFHGATTDRIAEQAGVAVGTIYNYFRHKEDVLAYIFSTEYEKRMSYFRSLLASELPALEKLSRGLSFHFQEVQKEPATILVMLREKGPLRSCHKVGQVPEGGMEWFIRTVLTRGLEREEIAHCNPDVLAVALTGALEACMERYLQEMEQAGASDVADAASGELHRMITAYLSPGNERAESR